MRFVLGLGAALSLPAITSAQRPATQSAVVATPGPPTDPNAPSIRTHGDTLWLVKRAARFPRPDREGATSDSLVILFTSDTSAVQLAAGRRYPAHPLLVTLAREMRRVANDSIPVP